MDTENLLKLLNAHSVDYLIIGAAAFPIHGYSRATLDIDIFIRPTEVNAKRAWEALREFGYDMSSVTIEEILSKKILIRQYIVETDIHPFVKGISFDEAWNKRVAGEIGTASAYFASLDDLITMKRAAGRARDKEDLKILLKLREKK